MKPPICKVCQKAHWTYDGHFVSDVQVPEYVKEMARGALGRESPASEVDKGDGLGAVAHAASRVTPRAAAAEPSRSTCNACNKPLHNRGKVCNACRQRAYRERSK